MKVNLPNSLVQSIQSDYVTSNYRDGVFTFQNIDVSTIEIIIQGFLAWAEENKHTNDNKLDISFVLGKDL